ncbi:hypothetical protein D3C87_1500050 [compost metagenome]
MLRAADGERGHDGERADRADLGEMHEAGIGPLMLLIVHRGDVGTVGVVGHDLFLHYENGS